MDGSLDCHGKTKKRFVGRIRKSWIVTGHQWLLSTNIYLSAATDLLHAKRIQFSYLGLNSFAILSEVNRSETMYVLRGTSFLYVHSDYHGTLKIFQWNAGEPLFKK